jgi:hypothetical protein
VGSARSSLIAVALLLCASCASSAATPIPTPAAVASSGCRAGTPEAGVYQPDRLKVVDPCRHAAGVVVDVAAEDDGDHHVWFRPDPGYESLMNAENHFQARPAMLAEITPDCQGNPADGEAASKCPRSRLEIPKLGDHIAVDGPWVLDMNHGWNEIHPVDSIAILGT